jgi:hypothetical protein
MDMVKSTIRSLTEIGLSLLAFGVVAKLLFGANVAFVTDVTANISGLISELGGAGLAGLLTLGIIVWLVQNK